MTQVVLHVLKNLYVNNIFFLMLRIAKICVLSFSPYCYHMQQHLGCFILDGTLWNGGVHACSEDGEYSLKVQGMLNNAHGYIFPWVFLLFLQKRTIDNLYHHPQPEKPFLFYHNQAGNTSTFESAAFPGWFIGTGSTGESPVFMTREVGKTHVTEFVLTTLSWGQLTQGLLPMWRVVSWLYQF